MIHAWDVQIFLRKRIDSIVHGKTLARILMILADDCLACKFRDAHDAISMIHTVFLDGIDGRVDLAT